MNNQTGILDLRAALEVLQNTPGQLVETSVEVGPAAELSGVYRYVGAGVLSCAPPPWTAPPPVRRSSIGVDPAIEVPSCFEPPTTPLGFNELSIAGALRQQPVELVKCLSVNEHAIANAEQVIEGEILPGSNHVVEDQNSHTGYAMPEFPGYNGPASHECWLLKVKAITHRRNPIMQACIGPSEKHVNMAGIPTEASILGMIDKALPGKVVNCYAHRSGGKYMAILQCKKTVHTDEGKQRQAALPAFSAFPELKHVILVDEDVLYTAKATVPKFQRLSIFVPEKLLNADETFPAEAKNVPVVFENNSAGYMQIPISGWTAPGATPSSI